MTFVSSYPIPISLWINPLLPAAGFCCFATSQRDMYIGGGVRQIGDRTARDIGKHLKHRRHCLRDTRHRC